jgi:Family of unknown function (DUF6510)
MEDAQRRLDGNAAGGVLSEVFAFEMTNAEGACANCGAVARVGAAMVYPHGMGTIVRCATCDNALMRLAHQGGSPGRYFLDLKGLKYLRIEEV